MIPTVVDERPCEGPERLDAWQAARRVPQQQQPGLDPYMGEIAVTETVTG